MSKKEKTLRDLFELTPDERLSKVGIALIKDGNNSYLFPPEKKNDILKRKFSTGKSAKNINWRCMKIQDWLVRMSENLDAVHKVLKKNPKNPHMEFLKLIGIKVPQKPYERPLSSYECLKVAWDIMPEAWRKI